MSSAPPPPSPPPASIEVRSTTLTASDVHRAVILGISPGNSYYRRSLFERLLPWLRTVSAEVVAFIPFEPHAHTLQAAGHPRPSCKAQKVGKRLVNALHRTDPSLRVLSWSDVVALAPERYRAEEEALHALVATNARFRAEADAASAVVLRHLSKGDDEARDEDEDAYPVSAEREAAAARPSEGTAKGGSEHGAAHGDSPSGEPPSSAHEGALEEARLYLVEELAALLVLPRVLRPACADAKVEAVPLLYHTPWPLFESLVEGAYDGTRRAQTGLCTFVPPDEVSAGSSGVPG